MWHETALMMFLFTLKYSEVVADDCDHNHDHNHQQRLAAMWLRILLASIYNHLSVKFEEWK